MKFISDTAREFDSSAIQQAFKSVSSVDKAINLSIGFPYATVPSQIKKAAIRAILSDKTTYTPTSGIDELKEKVLKKLSKKNKLSLESSKNITITSGLTFAICVIYLATLNENDEVIICDPYFPIFKELCKLTKAKPILLDTYPSFLPDLKKLKKLITKKAKILIINSPNNPTGAIYSKGLISEIAKVAKANNLLVISDEIYEDFVYLGQHFSIGSIHKNTLTLGGFSKSYAMTGFRIGYISGPKEIIKAINEIQQYTLFCPSSISQYAALKALDVSNEKIINDHKIRHDLVLKHLSKNFEINGGAGAFYLFLKCPKNAKGTAFAKKALEKKLIILPGETFSSKDEYFRISYATSIEDLKRGIEILNSLA